MTDNFLLIGTVTYDGKDYTLDKWVENLKKLEIPDGVDAVHQIVDNSLSYDHFKEIRDKTGAYSESSTSFTVYQRKPNQSLRYILKESYDVLWALAEDRPLFLLESDVLPPPNALKELWKFHIEHPTAGVIGCHVGYPKTPGDDGSKDGFYKYMCYRFLREDEQKFEEIEGIDAQEWDNIRPRILKKEEARKESEKFEFRVQNLKGRLWYQGFNEHRAIREYNKALGDYEMPMKKHRIPVFPPTTNLAPNLLEPQLVEGLHWGCTLIMPEVHQKIKPRFVEDKGDCPDTWFFRDCLGSVEVWSLPIVCLHQHQAWSQETVNAL